MTTWIIISACLYLIGMVPSRLLTDDEIEELSNPAKYLIMVGWPLVFLAIFVIIVYDYLKPFFKMKTISIILLVILCSCNDGGSDPEFVKAQSNFEYAKKSYDSALNENIRLVHARDSMLRVYDSLQHVQSKMFSDFLKDFKKQDSVFWKEYNKRSKQYVGVSEKEWRPRTTLEIRPDDIQFYSDDSPKDTAKWHRK